MLSSLCFHLGYLKLAEVPQISRMQLLLLLMSFQVWVYSAKTACSSCDFYSSCPHNNNFLSLTNTVKIIAPFKTHAYLKKISWVLWTSISTSKAAGLSKSAATKQCLSPPGAGPVQALLTEKVLEPSSSAYSQAWHRRSSQMNCCISKQLCNLISRSILGMEGCTVCACLHHTRHYFSSIWHWNSCHSAWLAPRWWKSWQTVSNENTAVYV